MDTVGDFLTIIRNGLAAKHEKVDLPASNIKAAVAEVLKKNSYISNYKVVKDGKQGMMRVYLNYNENGTPKITGIKRVSKPSLRRYVGKDEVPNVMTGYGMSILSTSKGVMSGGEARNQNVGGEVICFVW